MKRSICALILLLSASAIPANLHAVESVSTTGRISLRGVGRIDQESAAEDPSLTARLEVDVRESEWRLHSLIEGGWDGAVRNSQKNQALFKDLSRVYQDNSPFVEVKELALERKAGNIDCRIGIQRYSWGRLDEYPANDLLNPWDYNRFLMKSIEERKIGVPSVAIDMHKTDWTHRLVWVPWFIPYRLPEPDARWSVVPAGGLFSNATDARFVVSEPDRNNRTPGSFGLRMEHTDRTDWAITFFHGIDPRPVFKTTALSVTRSGGRLVIDPGLVPSFQTITSIGADGAMVIGDLSLRAETSYTLGRTFNIRQELWGYPEVVEPGDYPLHPVEVKRNTLDYGIGADYRLQENWLLTLQAQQTQIFGRPGSLYEHERETLFWANLKVSWLNEKIETNLSAASNPEHHAGMIRPGITYILSNTWKVSIIGLLLDGPPQSTFGRYAKNDQIEMVLTAAW